VSLFVGVNDELILDAGTTEELDGAELVIHPPKVTLFGQVLDYLRAKSDPASAPNGSTVENEGAAAAAFVLRWGSYLTVLADSGKPVLGRGSFAGDEPDLRLGDGADQHRGVCCACRVDRRLSRERTTYENLVSRALTYLPLPKLRARPVGSDFVMLAMPEVAAKIALAILPHPMARHPIAGLVA
jgi:hypothetical protein